MPKMKTRRAAAKRFRITGTGKIMRRRSRTKHLLEWKSAKQKRALGRDMVLEKGDAKKARVMMPYGES
jgi:large subunit ribosomal protein L35